MKSRSEFKTEDGFRNYLVAYYAGQALPGVIAKLSDIRESYSIARHTLNLANTMVSVVMEDLYEEEEEEEEDLTK